MAILTHKIAALDQLTSRERKAKLVELHRERLYGIEANDKVTRIARLNMYLHGDGGSRIYTADTLDKAIRVEAGADAESQRWLRELRREILDCSVRFDVVLTNPPFSMSYKWSDPSEAAVLNLYDIATGTSERSNVLFLERYLDLLDEGGELVTVIDNTVLNGSDSQHVRDFLLKHFVIRQVVALPFNTFFRAQANVQTSVVHLRRKHTAEEDQGDIFMGILNNVGHDDSQARTPERDNAGRLLEAWREWDTTGQVHAQSWPNESADENLGCPFQIFVVKASELDRKRLDAFYYAPALKKVRRILLGREERGELLLLRGSQFNIVKRMTASEVRAARGQIFRYFEIGDTAKDGQIVTWKEGEFTTLPTRGRLRVRAGDVLFAKNNSSRGRTVIVPPEFDGQLATTGFIGIRPRSTDEAFVLWSVLNSEAFREQVYYLAITASQPEVREEIFVEEFLVPYPMEEQELLRCARDFYEGNERVRKAVSEARTLAERMFGESH